MEDVVSYLKIICYVLGTMVIASMFIGFVTIKMFYQIIVKYQNELIDLKRELKERKE